MFRLRSDIVLFLIMLHKLFKNSHLMLTLIIGISGNGSVAKPLKKTVQGFHKYVTHRTRQKLNGNRVRKVISFD